MTFPCPPPCHTAAVYGSLRSLTSSPTFDRRLPPQVLIIVVVLSMALTPHLPLAATTPPPLRTHSAPSSSSGAHHCGGAVHGADACTGRAGQGGGRVAGGLHRPAAGRGSAAARRDGRGGQQQDAAGCAQGAWGKMCPPSSSPPVALLLDVMAGNKTQSDAHKVRRGRDAPPPPPPPLLLLIGILLCLTPPSFPAQHSTVVAAYRDLPLNALCLIPPILRAAAAAGRDLRVRATRSDAGQPEPVTPKTSPSLPPALRAVAAAGRNLRVRAARSDAGQSPGEPAGTCQLHRLRLRPATCAGKQGGCRRIRVWDTNSSPSCSLAV